tara:strand:+ start:72 stop:533 length:462 start_codon:yes stop_codon:yes gene_type:complete
MPAIVTDPLIDANKDTFILKSQTDAANNTQQLSLDGTTLLATNTPPLANDSVAFASATILGQETTNNAYVYSVKFDLVITTASGELPIVVSERKRIFKNNPPEIDSIPETWNVVPAVINIDAAPFLTFQVSSVTSSSTVKWTGKLELTVVTGL